MYINVESFMTFDSLKHSTADRLLHYHKFWMVSIAKEFLMNNWDKLALSLFLWWLAEN